MFTDVTPDSWYYSYVTRAAVYGIVEGFPDGTFHPDQQVSRAEATVLAVRTMDRALVLGGLAVGLAAFAVYKLTRR